MISVIIPVYNGERFIDSCYSNLCLQTRQDWEAIFINDGSSDDSSKLLTALRSQDKRIKIIQKQNEGVAVARAKGLKLASNDIVTFLDVDDTYPANALESYIEAFNHNDCDIVVGGINIVSMQNQLLYTIGYNKEILHKEKALDSLCDGKIRWQLCGKAFKRHLFDKCVTPTGIRAAEDMAVCIQLFLNAKAVVVLDNPCYNYIQVPTSATHSKAREIATDSLKALQFVESVSGNHINTDNRCCLTALLISNVLRGGIDPENDKLKSLSKRNFSLGVMRRIGLKKYLNVLIYKLVNINIAKYF